MFVEILRCRENVAWGGHEGPPVVPNPGGVAATRQGMKFGMSPISFGLTSGPTLPLLRACVSVTREIKTIKRHR
jgi:hypothetical protein